MVSGDADRSLERILTTGSIREEQSQHKEEEGGRKIYSNPYIKALKGQLIAYFSFELLRCAL